MKLAFKLDSTETTVASAITEGHQSRSEYERRLLKSPYGEPASFRHISMFHDDGSIKGPKYREKQRLLSNAVKHLPQEKKFDLLNSLSKLEDELKTPSNFGGASIAGSASHGWYSTNGGGGGGNGNEGDQVSAYDDLSISMMSASSLGVGFTEKKYGVVTESPLKIMQREVVRCLCKVGKAIEASELRHILGGRDMTEIVGLTALREFLYSRLKVSLSTKEAELLMKFIDTGNRGEVNIYDILGMAQLNYDKLRRRMKKRKDKEISGIERRELLVRRKDFRNKCEEEKLKSEDVLAKVLDVLKEASFKLISSKNMAVLASSRRLVMNSTLFQEALLEFGVDLTLRERKVLEQRYSSLDPPRTGYVDYPSFKSEFIALGAELLMARRKTDSIDRFLKAMSSMGAMPSSPTTHPPSSSSSAATDAKNKELAAIEALNDASGRGVSLNEVLAAAKPSLVKKPPKRRIPRGGKLSPIPTTHPQSNPIPHPDPDPEEFPGHPDISPAVTQSRNEDCRHTIDPTRPTMELNHPNNERRSSTHIRKAVDSFLDPEHFGMPIAPLSATNLTVSTKEVHEEEERKDQLQPLVGPNRTSRRTLERSPAASPTHAGAHKQLASPARSIRRNSHRRVSELIREAQKPGAVPAANNMAANLTEPHAFTSSIAILNMINASTELMVEAISNSSNPTIGLSSDFHRRLSVTNNSSAGLRIPSRNSMLADNSSLTSRSSLDSIADSDDDSNDSTPLSTSHTTPAGSRRPSSHRLIGAETSSDFAIKRRSSLLDHSETLDSLGVPAMRPGEAETSLEATAGAGVDAELAGSGERGVASDGVSYRGSAATEAGSEGVVGGGSEAGAEEGAAATATLSGVSETEEGNEGEGESESESEGEGGNEGEAEGDMSMAKDVLERGLQGGSGEEDEESVEDLVGNNSKNPSLQP